MTFSHPQHDLFIPDALANGAALSRTTHLGIGAHQDDLEFMALHGILECFRRDDRWFGGITCTDGAGSARTGPYVECTDEAMNAIRMEEQKAAAMIGHYSFMAQLGHSSAVAKDANRRSDLVDDIEAILRQAVPAVVYTHNPFDKHPTHVGVCLATLEAIRRLPEGLRPGQVFGCEVWRGLDWLPEDVKVLHDVSAHPNLAAALNGVFDSQITGGKRYDLAVEGRRLANATFLDAHSIDDAGRIAYAVDLTPLVKDPALTPARFAQSILDPFVASVIQLLQ
jgi:LmbE family N-acetylglucosaminyl deacetylase